MSNVVYQGKLIRVTTSTTPKGFQLETASRPPGTRIIVHDTTKNVILLNQEIRLDIGADLRLPGGKICNSIDEWDSFKTETDFDKLLLDSASREVREEAAINPTDLRFLTISTSGAPTVEFDLYFFVTNSFDILDHQELVEDEIIINVWTPVKEVIIACLTGKIREGRSVTAILQYLHSIGEL